MVLEKLNKLFDDAYLFDSDIEEDENGEYIEMYEVSDNIGEVLSFTTDSYHSAIDKVHDLSINFLEKYREYNNCEKNEIHFYIIKNRYYINESKDDLSEVVEEQTLLDTEIKRERWKKEIKQYV